MRHAILALLLLMAVPAAGASTDQMTRDYTLRCQRDFREPDRLRHCLESQAKGLASVRRYVLRYIEGRPANPSDPYQAIFNHCNARSTFKRDGQWPKLAYCLDNTLMDYLEMRRRGP